MELLHAIVALCAFMISLVGTRLTILAQQKRALWLELKRARGDRSLQKMSNGGIAVVMALVISMLVADVSRDDYIVVFALLLLAAAALLHKLLRLPDDLRLAMQVVAVAVTLVGMKLPDWGMPVWCAKVLLGIAWLWFINIFKMMDRIDGISATEMMAIGTGLCLVAVLDGTFPHPLPVYGLIIACTGCGFIWWNWYPARITLGEVGTVPIAFFLGYLLVLALVSGYGYAAAILPAYYYADGLITLGRRWRQGKGLWMRHSEHYYQKALARGRSPHSITLLIAGIDILLIFLACKSELDGEYAVIYVSLAYLAVFMLLGFFAFDTSKPGHER